MPLKTTDKSFEDSVLEGIEQIETKQETLLKNYEQLDKDTKKAMEELTTLKNKANSIAETETALKKLQIQLNREQRMAFGNPIERIVNDDEKRERFNAAIRLALCKEGEKFGKEAIERVKSVVGKALGEDTSPGSTLINTELARDIYDTLALYGAWNTLGVRNMGSRLQSMPVKTARAGAYVILNEGGVIPDDADKAGAAVNLKNEVIAVLLNISLQLLEDAEVDITADVMDDFVESWNYRLDYLAFAADGTADNINGGMTGLFNFGTAAPAAAGNTLIENTQLDDFIRCLTTVDVGVLQRMAKWWMHPQILARALLVRDANGRSIFLTALEAPAQGSIGSILGYGVTQVAAAPAVNAANKKVAAFGDPRGFAVGVRRSYVFEASDHHKWNALQRSFRGWGRAGTKGKRANAFAILTTAAA
jgi:HK97 family phage major capsid protein